MLKSLLPIVLFLGLAAAFQFSSPNIADPDSFYHIRHAWLYRTEGLLTTNFPWTYFSVIKTLSSDLWYGFHILLIPATYFDNLIFGIKLSSVILTFFALYAVYWVIKRHKIKWPVFWPILMFFSAPNIMYRLLMMRPHLLSSALGLILFSSLIINNGWLILIASFLIAWIHLNMIWLPFLIFAVIALVKLIAEKKIIWRPGGFILAGTLLGWFLRPNPLGAAKLFYIQVLKLLLEKQKGLPLLFGTELFPLSWEILFKNFSLFLFLWLGAAILFFWFRKSTAKQSPNQNNILAWSSLIASAVFFILTMVTARRAHDFWIIFGIIFMAAIFSYISVFQTARFKNYNYLITATLMILFSFLVFYSPYKNANSLENRATKPDRYKNISLWLKQNSQPAEIVFNLHWSDFPMLFFWNQQNYYIGGMDPIFQYAYNPELYWKFHYLSADEVTKKTCGSPACTASMLTDTYGVLKNNFKAGYIVLDKNLNPAVYSFLESDKRFEKKLDEDGIILYMIK